MKSPSITPETFRTFDPLVKNFRLTAPNVRAGWESKTLAPRKVRCSRDSDFFDVPELWWRPAGELRLQAFTKKLQYWLHTQKLPASDEIVDILTGMVAVRVLDGVGLASILSEMQDATRNVDVFQIQMLPEQDTSEWFGSLEWRGFRLGALDSDKLAYKCKKAKAAWFEAQSRKVDGVKSIQSPVTKRTLMDWSSVCWSVRSPNIKQFGPSLISITINTAPVFSPQPCGRSSRMRGCCHNLLGFMNSIFPLFNACAEATCGPSCLGSVHPLLTRGLARQRMKPQSKFWIWIGLLRHSRPFLKSYTSTRFNNRHYSP